MVKDRAMYNPLLFCQVIISLFILQLGLTL